MRYLSEVWAGYLVGTGWLIVGVAIAEWTTVNGRINWQAPARPGGRKWVMLLALADLGWYLAWTANWHPRRFTPPPVQPMEIR